MNFNAELHKVVREIQTHGMEYKVFRYKLDEYGEQTKETEQIKIVNGLFHTSKGYVSQTTADGTRVHGKGQPKLLVEYEKTKEINNGDYLEINGNKYKVIEKNNIQQFNIVVDMSLELMLDGRN